MSILPARSKSLLSDFKNFILKHPPVDSLVKINTAEVREEFDKRILQRTGYVTDQYRLLNIHQISIDCPTEYVFDEIIRWHWESRCWPKHIARFVRKKGITDDVSVYLFRPLMIGKKMRGYSLFNLKLIKIHQTPPEGDADNARYLIYESSGGYPIGLIIIYTRNSIADMNETGKSQLFFVVGFNFYGRKSLSNIIFIKKLWELIHNRVTANILNRFKHMCEAKLENYANNGTMAKSSLSGQGNAPQPVAGN